MEKIGINRNYKDSLFRMLFGENKENALSLYNAVNGSHYENADDLEYTTLGDVVYMKMKNDLSFIFAHSMSLYEHQSTFNPNMPLRGFLYFADLYRKIMPSGENLYGRRLVKIPAPRYIVFYNGTELQPERQKLRLSDAFEIPDSSGDFEWTATMININGGESDELKESCRVLKDYTFFVECVRMYAKDVGYGNAVDKAVDTCISKGVLADFLSKHRKEVMNMTLTEFDEEKYREVIREEGREEGREEERVSIILNCLLAGRSVDEVSEFLGIPVEEVERVKNSN